MPYCNLEEELQFELEIERITIDPSDNICTVCGTPYPYRKVFSFKVDGLKNVEFVTAHAGCRSLVNKIKKLKDELLNLEFKLYCKRT